MKSSKKVIADIVNRTTKSGIVAGNKGKHKDINWTSNNGQDSLGLRYKCYNPSLIKQDFIDLLPSDKRSSIEFNFLKKRDPKYFQFNDTYYLFFRNHIDLNTYYNDTAMGKINKMRVHFLPMGPDTSSSPHNNGKKLMEFEKTHNILNKYSKNLYNAFESKEKYFDGLEDNLDVTTEYDIKTINEIESKSVLVWNLPITTGDEHLKNIFWFYDIKHCFKLFWNDKNLGSKLSSLHYFAFNNPIDAEKFKNNYHGTFFNDDINHKMLIDRL